MHEAAPGPHPLVATQEASAAVAWARGDAKVRGGERPPEQTEKKSHATMEQARANEIA